MPIDPRQIEVMDDAMAEVLRQKTGAERLRVTDGLLMLARQMIVSALRAQHPDWDPRRIQAEASRRNSHGAV